MTPLSLIEIFLLFVIALTSTNAMWKAAYDHGFRDGQSNDDSIKKWKELLSAVTLMAGMMAKYQPLNGEIETKVETR